MIKKPNTILAKTISFISIHRIYSDIYDIKFMLKFTKIILRLYKVLCSQRKNPAKAELSRSFTIFTSLIGNKQRHDKDQNRVDLQTPYQHCNR